MLILIALAWVGIQTYIYMLLNASIGLLITKNTLGFYKVYSGLENEPLFSSTRKCQGLPNIR